MPLTGVAELKQQIKTFREKARPAYGAALYEEGVAIIGLADEDVPYQFGHLRRSHFATLPTGAEPKVEIGYGAGYGLFVHEVPANHPKGGKDHFLRDRFNQRMVGFEQRLAKRIEGHIAAGTGIQPSGIPTERPDPMEAILAALADRRRQSRRNRAAKIRSQNARRSARGRR